MRADGAPVRGMPVMTTQGRLSGLIFRRGYMRKPMRRLYSKWNVTEIFEGTGKRPKDLAPSMSAAEAIKEVQRRANQAC